MDREKVIKGLAYCTRPSEVGKGGNFCMDCPYTEPIGFNQFKCNGQQMMGDALALLKEQEAIKPEPIMGTSVCDCGKCKHLVAPGMNYCPVCGCKIDWN